MATKTWTYGLCESCLKNSHERIEMGKEAIKSRYPEIKNSEEMWVCPICGATKKL